MKAIPCAYVLAIISGSAVPTVTATGADDSGVMARPEPIGHIYVNVATGEQIMTRLSDGIRPAVGNEGDEIWATQNLDPCGIGGGALIILDAPNGEFGIDPREAGTLYDWGDIPTDSVVDCVQVSWFTFVTDVDEDGDSLGDGVEGFAATWVWYDNDQNGTGDVSSSPIGILAITLVGLAGSFDGTFAGYITTLDLAGSFGSSAAFEIGDTDSDLQDAAIHNPGVFIDDSDSDGIPDGDPDGDGLADFGYTVGFIQPGRVDFDNADGDSDTTTGVDGDPANAGLAAISLAAPDGFAVDNGDGTFSFVIDPVAVPNATGAEDGFEVLGFAVVPSDLADAAGGIFTCDAGAEVPNVFGQVEMHMFHTGSSECIADFSGDGQLTIADILDYLDLFNAGDPAASLDGDPALNIFDILIFLDLFNAGCP